MKRVMIMAGGTGGHVFPALAVARELEAMGAEVTWLGTRRGIEATVVPAAGLPIDWLTIQGIRRQALIDWLALPFRLVYAMAQAYSVLRRRKPQVVLAMGGFVAGPGALMAAMLRIPLVVHEQNAIAGFTNRWLALIADRVVCGFPGAFGRLPGTQHVGNPVRRDILQLSPPGARPPATGRPLRLLVVGGSQGAAIFNHVVPDAIAALAPAVRPEVWHQAGRVQTERTATRYRDYGITARVVAFVDDMAAAYAWADVLVCRAGAMTVAEVCAAGVAAVFVPLPLATDDHQTANARFVSDRDAAMRVPQSEFTATRLAGILAGFAANPELTRQMAIRARGCAVPDAGPQVARVCLEAAHA